MRVLDEKTASVWRSEPGDYPVQPPFHPHIAYPEYGFVTDSEPNLVYDSVRSTFHIAGLDSENYGKPSWNPLGQYITPGQVVLLKPNLVKEFHPRDPEGWKYVLTHGSVIRAVADYVCLALKGRGKIVLADAPHTDSSFDKVVEVLGLDSIRDFFRSHGVDFELVDIRQDEWTTRDAIIVERRKRPGDPAGYIAYDLGDRSEFVGHAGTGRYIGADYDTGELNQHHSAGRHEYLISGSVMKADVIFSIPKLKTHKKAGITVTLKNLVGINGDKNWLPHHTEGSLAQGGDEHPRPSLNHRTERAILPFFYQLSRRLPVLGPWIHRRARLIGQHIFGHTEEVVRSGNWWGNDTVWRMCLDLNKILLYGNPDGSLRPSGAKSRKLHLTLVDGFIAGEGRGPMNPDPVASGIFVFGVNPATVDAVCAYLMGFDPEKIRIVANAFRCRELPIAEWSWQDVVVLSNFQQWNGRLCEIPDETTFHFRPHFGWANYVERTHSVPV